MEQDALNEKVDLYNDIKNETKKRDKAEVKLEHDRAKREHVERKNNNFTDIESRQKAEEKANNKQSKGKFDSDVKDALTKRGLKSKVTTQYSDDVETGKVIGTNPVAGSEVAKDTVIEIFVSRGKEVKNVVVPDVLGWDGAEAKSHLESKKLVVKVVEQETENVNDIGNVIDQSIAANKEVPENTTITITVGKEKPTETDPEPPTEEPPTEEPPTEEPPTEPTEGDN